MVDYVLYLISQSVAIKFALNVHIITHIFNHYLKPHRRLQYFIAHKYSALTQEMINCIGGLCSLPSITKRSNEVCIRHDVIYDLGPPRAPT